ncbi:MAG: thioredoxin fold domain-containing protein, partial [Saprospiraceae bacterium]
MSYAEIIIFTQPYCPHCELVKDQIATLKANNAGITHADLLPGAANKNDAAHQLATRYSITSTPSAVLIEGQSFQVYTGTEIFMENQLQDLYRAAQNRDPLKKKKATQPGTLPGEVPTVIVDPG